jgi:hypothetical protein
MLSYKQSNKIFNPLSNNRLNNTKVIAIIFANFSKLNPIALESFIYDLKSENSQI